MPVERDPNMGDLSAVIMIFRLQLFEVIPGKCDDGGVAIKPSTYLPSIRSTFNYIRAN